MVAPARQHLRDDDDLQMRMGLETSSTGRSTEGVCAIKELTPVANPCTQTAMDKVSMMRLRLHWDRTFGHALLWKLFI